MVYDASSKPLAPGVYTTPEELIGLRYLAKDLVLTAKSKSHAVMDGNVRTKYKGRGMEFAEVRPYQPGDDVRTIDWRVTARMQSPYTKLFQEERERPIFVLVDQRSPMFFGSQTQFKSVFAAKLAAMIAWTAHAHNDRIGALIFSDGVQHDIRAKRSKHAVLDLIHQLASANTALTSPVPVDTETSVFTMLTEANRIIKPGSLVFLISDFHDFTTESTRMLSALAKRSDVRLFHVYDQLEQKLPAVSNILISNKKQRLALDVRKMGAQFERQFELHQQQIRQACANAGVQFINAPCQHNLAQFATDIFANGRARKIVRSVAGGQA